MVDKLEDKSVKARLWDIPKGLRYQFLFPVVHNVIVSNHTIFLKIVRGRTQRENF